MNFESEKSEELNLVNVLKVIGNKISMARKESKKKIDSVSRALKIRSEYLVAIEEGNMDDLPEEVYLKGFIRSYAKYFDIDISDELGILNSNLDKSKDKELKQKDLDTQMDSLPNLRVIFIVLFVFLLVFLSWNEYKKRIITQNMVFVDRNVQITQNTSNEMARKFDMTDSKDYNKALDEIEEKDVNEDINIKESKNINNFKKENSLIIDNIENSYKELDSQSVEQNNERNIKFKLTFIDTSWIQIKSLDGKIFKSGIFNDGDSIILEIDDQNSNYFLDTGNAGGFKLFLNNEELPVLGQLGSVRKEVSLLDFLNQNNNVQ